MNLFPISDIHIGMRPSFWDEENIRNALGFIDDYDDLVMCACGDIGDRMEGILWLQKVLSIFPKLRIVYTPGNHEFYGANMDILPHDLMTASQRIDRLYVLDGTYFFKHTIDNVDFVGATLWTDFNKNAPAIKNHVQYNMNDYNYIRSTGQFKAVTADRIFNEHCEQRKEIFKYMNSSSEKKFVCMSHHSPIILDGGHVDGLTYGYCSDLEFMFNEAQRVPTYWFSGHTHSSRVIRKEFTNGETTFISNQMGYPKEFNTGYTNSCILEI